MFNFSFAMIMRNEVGHIEKFLSSIKYFLDNWGDCTIIDTGSTDGSPEIARNLGATVYEVWDRFRKKLLATDVKEINEKFVEEWEKLLVREWDILFDFASARNYAFSMAKSSFAFTPDCDEVVTAMDFNVINKTIEEWIDQIEFSFVFAHNPDGSEAVKFLQCKWANKTKLQWRGMVHECLFPIVDQEIKRRYLPEKILKIEHWQNEQTSRGNYLSGLAYDCLLNPYNDRNSHYLARELMWNGRPKSAIREFKRHLTLGTWGAERAESMVFIGDCTENEQEKLDWYNKAFQEDPSRRKALLRLASHFYGKDHQKCACFASAALQIPTSGYYAEDMREYREFPHELLYCSLGWMGRENESRYHYDKACEFAPNNPKYIHDRQYYYEDEYKDQGIQGWMSIKELNWLYQQAKKCDTILEIGSWKGRSTHALLSWCKGQVTCVDTFQWSVADKGDLTVSMAEKEDIFEQFEENTKEFKDKLRVFTWTSEDAALRMDYDHEMFDMVFIDWTHTEEAVRQDIALWKDKAKMIICGHDYCAAWPGTVSAVNEAFGKPDGVEDSIWYVNIK